MVKGIVEMHKGAVAASSEGQGKGAEFIVRRRVSPPRLVSIRMQPSGLPFQWHRNASLSQMTIRILLRV